MKKTTPILQEKYARKSLLCQFRFLRRTLLLVALAATSSNYLVAQCQLEATDINISVDANCENLIEPGDFANTTGCPGGEFIVNVYFDGELIPTSPTVTSDYVGEQVILELVDTISGNSTWSYGNVEDYTAPHISCNFPPDTIVCGEELPDSHDPIIQDNCGGEVEPIMVDEFFEDIECDSVLSGRLTRVWVAQDENGAVSEPCTVTAVQRRLTMEDIDWPDSLLVLTNNSLDCSEDWDFNGNGVPDPLEINSIPQTVLGSDLFPFNNLCNVTTSFVDTEYPSPHCNREIRRHWRISEWWCGTTVDFNYIQLIEIADTIPPTLVCPQDFTVSRGTHDCCAEIELPPVLLEDNCQDVSSFEVDIRYPGGFLNNQNGGTIEYCGSGSVLTVEYRVFDQCNVSTSCFVDVTVEDLNPPIPVCNQDMIVSLTQDGLGKAYAHSFDEGSLDNCDDVYFKVRRMNINECEGVNGDDNENINGYQEYYDDYVKFCCEDVGGEDVMVFLRVYDVDPGEGPVLESRHQPGGDLFGRFNDCMVNVEVQDKLAPLVDCPPDITVTCTFDYDENDLSVFGSVVIGEENREEIIILDADSSSTPINWGLDGFTSDNCVASIDEVVTKKLDACGLGTLEREFIATDLGGRTAECTQIITIRRVNPFDGDDIVWPLDYEANNTDCSEGGLIPDNLPAPFDRPVIDETECDQVGVDYEDEFFSFSGEEEACFKILRTWKVIDWCGTYTDPSTGGTVIPRWEHIQVIKVFNTVAPEFTSGCDSITVSTDDPECSGGFVELIATAQDDCTPEEDLIYSYQIDAFRDGTIDIANDGNNASGTFPVGRHTILWTVEDRCGNRFSCTQPFTVLNTKKPTPLCQGIVTVLMESDGTVEIWATDLDKGSVHSCPGVGVTPSFDSETIVNNMTFTCDDLGVNEVQLWIIDDLGNSEFCIVEVEIQDDNNSNACDGFTSGEGDILGLVATSEDENVENVEVSLVGSATQTVMTGENGLFAFPDMPMGGSYSIEPYKNDDHKNGVSTLDILLIQRHILGIEIMEDPYDLVAADVNNSQTISAIDMVEIRKLLLGEYGEFPSNTSWRFIDEDYEFPNPSNPWSESFPEQYIIDPFEENMMEVDFIAVKVGDVSGDVETTNLLELEDRTAGAVVLNAVDQSFQRGEMIEVPMHLFGAEDVLTYQYELLFDTDVLAYMGHENGQVILGEENYNVANVNDGRLRTLWFDEADQILLAGQDLYTFKFMAKRNGTLSDVLSISEDNLKAEANDRQREVMDIRLEFTGETSEEADVVLFQNRPNPFSYTTEISFMLDEAKDATITILDVTGKIILAKTGYFDKGLNVVEVQASEINAHGVLYYRLETEDFMDMKKMILVR